jgi:hypothetical protein
VPGFDQTTPMSAGRTLGGRYTLVSPIAKGGMAEVWEGRDEILSRPVAVKVLQAHLATDDVFLERFRREAVAAARLAHPAVVATFDTGVDGGTAYIVMELVNGRTLRQLLAEQGALEPWQAVAITRQITDALSSAHHAGLVHRDIKPANVLLVDDEWGGLRVKVTDFGIAKAGAESGRDLTRTGIVLGTPKYLSPEQIRGADPDARADLYSLGVVLYEMLAGEPPFVGDNDMATAFSHLHDKVPKVSSKVRNLPPGLDRIVAGLLAKDPDKRIPSAQDLRQRLDSLGPLAMSPLPPPAPGGGGVATDAGAWRPDPGRGGRPGLGGGGDSGRPAGRRPPAHSARVRAEREGRQGSDRRGARGAEAATPVVPEARRGDDTSSLVPGEDATNALDAVANQGPRTDELAGGAQRRPHQSGRIAGMAVLGLLLLGGLVAGLVLSAGSGGSAPPRPQAPHSANTAAAVRIASVSVFMYDNRPPDDPQGVSLAYDGNPSTYWQTDQYASPTFGNYYPGIGLDIRLVSSAPLQTLSVTSPSTGWSASVYVSATPVASGQGIGGWGPAVDSKTPIDGNAVFDLGGHQGMYVLLWITNLGPADQVRIAELAVH